MTTARIATGSRLLGTELRRLRGARKLQDVVSLSAASAHLGGPRPLSVAALSEIENGKYLPSLDALLTLCLTYHASPARFVRRVLEDRLIAGQDVPDDNAQLESETAAAMRDSRWVRALALVVVGEDRAKDLESRLRWRLRHALVLGQIGMLDQAIHELEEILDTPALPRPLRARVHLDIVNAASRVGHITQAAFHCAAALDEAGDDVDPALRLHALQASVALSIRRHVQGCGSDRDLREALRRIDEAVTLLRDEDAAPRFCLEIYRAQVQERLGNRTHAHELYRRLEAEGAGASPHLRACLLVSHAELLVASGSAEPARRKLEEAARLATDAHAVDHAFEAHAVLMSIARNDRERQLHRRACRKFLALATAPTPRMLEFESALFGGAS